jgi:AcrR family transcriptional regulator
VEGRDDTLARRLPTPLRAGERGDERWLQIINAAAEAFMTEGFAATSIDSIAHLLGCTKGLIYYHFKNKTELFFAVHWHTMETNLAILQPIADRDGSAINRVRDMVHAHIDSIIERLPFQRVALMGLEMHIVGSTTPQEREMLDNLMVMYHRYEDLFVTVIKEGIAEGVFIAGDARKLVKPALGAMNWMVMWYRPRQSTTKAARDKLCGNMSSFILRGLGVPADRA